jgi:hypothetical protein
MAFDHTQNEILREIARCICEISKTLKQLVPQPTPALSGKIFQIIKGEVQMAITGTNAGGTSVFEVDAILNGVVDTAGFPAGTVDTWTTDDPQAQVGPDSGPDVNQTGTLDQVSVSIPAGDTQGSAPAGQPGSYNLTASVQMPAPTSGPNSGVVPAPIVVTVNVPINTAAPAVPTGAVINQIS